MLFKLDTLADQRIKKDASGDTLYYPWIIFGSGFILNSKNIENQIRKLHKILMIYSLINLPFIVFCLDRGIIIFCAYLSIYLFVYYICFYFTVRKITKGLQKTKEKIKLFEAYRYQAQSLSLSILVLWEILFIGAAASIVWILLFNKDAPPPFSFASIFFWLGLGVMCFTSIIYGYMITTKIRN